MTNREKIAARIRALRNMTVENGCTEDEAISAAAILAKLLAEHNMTLDEASLRESPFQRHTEHVEDLVGERAWKIADGVAHLVDIKYWTSRAGVHPVEINFFGFAHEVEIAKYLLEICVGAMRREHRYLRKDFRLLTIPRQRAKIIPFLDGMADRLRLRIRELRPPAPTGTGIVVLRGELIHRALKDEGVKLDSREQRASRDFDTYGDGVRAADRVSLNRGLTAPDRPTERLLGGR